MYSKQDSTEYDDKSLLILNILVPLVSNYIIDQWYKQNLDIMKTICFIFTIAIAFGCRMKESSIEQDNRSIKIDFQGITLSDNSSNIKEIEYLPLETNENILINWIDKIIFHNSKFYLLDLSLNTIFIFNRDGSFYKKISNIGKGSGEYLHIMDFDINFDNSIWIYDNYSNKIIIYNDSLTDYNEIKLKYRFEEFVIKTKNQIFTRNLYSEGTIHSRVAELDIEKMNYKVLLDKSSYQDDFDITRIGRYIFFKSSNSLLFNPRFTDKICRIFNGEIQEIYKITENFPDAQFIEKIKNDPTIIYSQDNYVLSIEEIFESSDYLSLRVSKNMYDPKTYFYSKVTTNLLNINLMNDNKYFGNTIIKAIAEDKFVSLFIPNENIEKQWYKSNINSSNLDSKNKNILLNAGLYDNPIIILFNLIEF